MSQFIENRAGGVYGPKAVHPRTFVQERLPMLLQEDREEAARYLENECPVPLSGPTFGGHASAFLMGYRHAVETLRGLHTKGA